MKSIWQAIVIFTEQFGQVLSRTILTLLYFVLIGPVGIFFSLFSDRLGIKPAHNTNWLPSPSPKQTLDKARRQS